MLKWSVLFAVCVLLCGAQNVTSELLNSSVITNSSRLSTSVAVTDSEVKNSTVAEVGHITNTTEVINANRTQNSSSQVAPLNASANSSSSDQASAAKFSNESITTSEEGKQVNVTIIDATSRSNDTGTSNNTVTAQEVSNNTNASTNASQHEQQFVAPHNGSQPDTAVKTEVTSNSSDTASVVQQNTARAVDNATDTNASENGTVASVDAPSNLTNISSHSKNIDEAQTSTTQDKSEDKKVEGPTVQKVEAERRLREEEERKKAEERQLQEEQERKEKERQRQAQEAEERRKAEEDAKKLKEEQERKEREEAERRLKEEEEKKQAAERQKQEEERKEKERKAEDERRKAEEEARKRKEEEERKQRAEEQRRLREAEEEARKEEQIRKAEQKREAERRKEQEGDGEEGSRPEEEEDKQRLEAQRRREEREQRLRREKPRRSHGREADNENDDARNEDEVAIGDGTGVNDGFADDADTPRQRARKPIHRARSHSLRDEADDENDKLGERQRKPSTWRDRVSQRSNLGDEGAADETGEDIPRARVSTRRFKETERELPQDEEAEKEKPAEKDDGFNTEGNALPAKDGGDEVETEQKSNSQNAKEGDLEGTDQSGVGKRPPPAELKSASGFTSFLMTVVLIVPTLLGAICAVYAAFKKFVMGSTDSFFDIVKGKIQSFIESDDPASRPKPQMKSPAVNSEKSGSGGVEIIVHSDGTVSRKQPTSESTAAKPAQAKQPSIGLKKADPAAARQKPSLVVPREPQTKQGWDNWEDDSS